eukprot:scaffold78606_cov20-Prasinocladus_malaysianus.AAC.1
MWLRLMWRQVNERLSTKLKAWQDSEYPTGCANTAATRRRPTWCPCAPRGLGCQPGRSASPSCAPWRPTESSSSPARPDAGKQLRQAV